MLWGVWQDFESNVYVAVFNEKVIKKIDKNGEVTKVYKSEKGWAPAHGLFDNNNHLWVLEWSDKNEVRAAMIDKAVSVRKKNGLALPVSVGIALILAAGIGFMLQRKGLRY